MWGLGRAGMAGRAGNSAGLSLIEVCIAIAIVATVLLSLAGAFSTDLLGVDQARRVTDGSVFLETCMENLAAQPYENLLALDGEQIFDRTDAGDSKYVIDLRVFPSEVGLMQVRAVLADLRTNREIGRVTALRSWK